MVNIPFKRGDFITHVSRPMSFAIYEGVDLYPSFTYAKLMSLALWYSPYDYVKDEENDTWHQTERFITASEDKPCDMKYDATDIGKWRKLTQEEINEAYKVMNKHGVYYDSKKMTLHHDGGALIYELKGETQNDEDDEEETIQREIIKYNGETIILTNNDTKERLRNAAHKKAKEKEKTTNYYDQYSWNKRYDEYDEYYNRYGHYYD